MQLSREGARSRCSSRFSRNSVSGSARAVGVVLICVLVIGLIVLVAVDQCDASVAYDRTDTGEVEAKYVHSYAYSKSYFVTVKNGKYKADHEVSLAEYNAAKKGDPFPIVLDMKSGNVEADEQEESGDAAAAAAAVEAQAARAATAAARAAACGSDK